MWSFAKVFELNRGRRVSFEGLVNHFIHVFFVVNQDCVIHIRIIFIEVDDVTLVLLKNIRVQRDIQEINLPSPNSPSMFQYF